MAAGGHGRGGTPGPIPNPEVKPPSADGTAERVRGRAGRRRPPRGILPGEAPSASAEGAFSRIQAARVPRRGAGGRVRPPGPLSGMGGRAPASAPEACEQGRDGALGEGRHAVRGAADGGVHAAPAQGRVPVDLRLRVGGGSDAACSRSVRRSTPKALLLPLWWTSFLSWERL